MTSILVTATALANGISTNRYPVNVTDAEPIEFVERGIRFFVFMDGQFDFSTEPSAGSDVYYRQSGRRNVNSTYGAPANIRVEGVRIEHDAKGRVRRIGNVFVNYDAFDRIKRIGSIYMSYNRFALAQVGNLRLVYNTRGQIVDRIGSVNGYCESEYGYYDNSYYGPANGATPYYNDDYYYRRGNNKK